MAVIDHGVWERYTPEDAGTVNGMPILYLRNEEGIDLYRFFAFLEAGASLVEVFPETGNVFGFTGMDGEPIDYTTRFPVGRRLLEVRPARTDLKGMRWDGTDFVAIPEPVPEITQRQLRLWLVRHGYALAAVEAVIDGLPEPARTEAQIEWDYASKFDPSHTTLITVAAALGIPDVGQAAREAALI